MYRIPSFIYDTYVLYVHNINNPKIHYCYLEPFLNSYGKICFSKYIIKRVYIRTIRGSVHTTRYRYIILYLRLRHRRLRVLCVYTMGLERFRSVSLGTFMKPIVSKRIFQYRHEICAKNYKYMYLYTCV